MGLISRMVKWVVIKTSIKRLGVRPQAQLGFWKNDPLNKTCEFLFYQKLCMFTKTYDLLEDSYPNGPSRARWVQQGPMGPNEWAQHCPMGPNERAQRGPNEWGHQGPNVKFLVMTLLSFSSWFHAKLLTNPRTSETPTSPSIIVKHNHNEFWKHTCPKKTSDWLRWACSPSLSSCTKAERFESWSSYVRCCPRVSFVCVKSSRTLP